MRPIAGTCLLWVIALAGVACSRKPESPVRTATTKPGVVTLRFVNTTPWDIFVDAQYGENVIIEDKLGRRLGGPEFCGTDCETCNRHVCGSPETRVRRIPKGSTWESAWQGDFYESAPGDKDCTCMRRRLAEDGTYAITLHGRTAAKSVSAAPSSGADIVNGDVDETSKECIARGTATLGVSASSADIAWSCPP